MRAARQGRGYAASGCSKIELRKLTDERHTLAVARPDGSREEVPCETHSLLPHNRLHFAVEKEAQLQGGFWGALAAGKSLAEVNDRDAPGPLEGVLMQVERAVGALHNAAKGARAFDVMPALRRYAETSGAPLPGWLDQAFLERVQARLRGLLGAWMATRRGEEMLLQW